MPNSIFEYAKKSGMQVESAGNPLSPEELDGLITSPPTQKPAPAQSSVSSLLGKKFLPREVDPRVHAYEQAKKARPSFGQGVGEGVSTVISNIKEDIGQAAGEFSDDKDSSTVNTILAGMASGLFDLGTLIRMPVDAATRWAVKQTLPKEQHTYVDMFFDDAAAKQAQYREAVRQGEATLLDPSGTLTAEQMSVAPATAELLSYVLDPTMVAGGGAKAASALTKASKFGGRAAARNVAMPTLEKAGQQLAKLAPSNLMGRATRAAERGAGRALAGVGEKLTGLAETKLGKGIQYVAPVAATLAGAGAGGPILGGILGVLAGAGSRITMSKRGGQIIAGLGKAMQEWGKTTAGHSSLSRLAQLRLAPSTPGFITSLADKLAVADKPLKFLGEMRRAAGAGADIMAPGMAAKLAEGNAGEAGALLGSGWTLGSMGHLVAAPVTHGLMRNKVRRAMEDVDTTAWYSGLNDTSRLAIDKAYEAARQEALADGKTEKQADGIARRGVVNMSMAEALVNSLRPVDGESVQFQYLNEVEWTNVTGIEPGPAGAYYRDPVTGEDKIAVNADRIARTTQGHELLHLLAQDPRIVDYSKLSNTLFSQYDLTDPTNPTQLSQGFYDLSQQAAMGQRYIDLHKDYNTPGDPTSGLTPASESFVRSLEAERLNQPERFKQRVLEEIVAEHFGTWLAETDLGPVLRSLDAPSRRLIDAVLTSESRGWGVRMLNNLANRLGYGDFTAAGRSPLYGAMLSNPRLEALFRNILRERLRVGGKQKPGSTEFGPSRVGGVRREGGEWGEGSFEAREITTGALDPRMAELFPDSDIWVRNPDGSIFYDSATGRPRLRSPGDIRRLQQRRVAAIFAAMNGLPPSADPGAMRQDPNSSKDRFIGQHFTDDQMQAILALPDEIMPPSMKEKLRRINEASKQQTGLSINYNPALLKGRQYSTRLGMSYRVGIPLRMDITQAGNLLVITMDHVRLNDKLHRWWDKDQALRAGGKNPQWLAEWNDFTQLQQDLDTYLENTRMGYPGETGLTVAKKNRLNDLLNITRTEHLDKNVRLSTRKGDEDTIIRSRRFDRINSVDVIPSGRSPLGIGYERVVQNLQPVNRRSNPYVNTLASVRGARTFLNMGQEQQAPTSRPTFEANIDPALQGLTDKQLTREFRKAQKTGGTEGSERMISIGLERQRREYAEMEDARLQSEQQRYAPLAEKDAEYAATAELINREIAKRSAAPSGAEGAGEGAALQPPGAAPHKPQVPGGKAAAISSSVPFKGNATEGPGLIQFQPVHHGSRHKFDRLSAARIGSGEGAQMYGWGLYVAQDPSVARYYQLAGADNPNAPTRQLLFNNRPFDSKEWMMSRSLDQWLLEEGKDPRNPQDIAENIEEYVAQRSMWETMRYLEAAAKNERYNENATSLSDAVWDRAREYLNSRFAYLNRATDVSEAERAATPRMFQEALKTLDYAQKNELLKLTPIEGAAGYFYRFELDDYVTGKMLMYDHTLGEQPAYVKERLAKALEILKSRLDPAELEGYDGEVREYADELLADIENTSADGNDLYWAMVSIVQNFGKPEADDKGVLRGPSGTRAAMEVSWALDDAGIHGIEYFDSQSRGYRRDQTKNYVIFDDKWLDVASREDTATGITDVFRSRPSEELAKHTPTKREMGMLQPSTKPVVTRKGTVIKRDGEVGKRVGPQLYVHKDYADEKIPAAALAKARAAFGKAGLDWEPNGVMYDKNTGVVRFDEAPDFDTASEPRVGRYFSVAKDGTTKEGSSNAVWHHKWLWVKDDYSGFDVNEAREWSREYASKLPGAPIGGSVKAWEAQLARNNITRPAQYRPGAKLTPKEQKLWPVEMKQERSSKKTSVPGQIPAKKYYDQIGLKKGSRNADIGAGQSDAFTRYLKTRGVENLVYDPFWRTREQNEAFVRSIRKPTDTATVNNVLNVIAEPEIRDMVIRQAASTLKPDGVAYFKIYEGNKSRKGADTGQERWQNNMPAADYMPRIEKYFKEVTRRGDMIIATSPRKRAAKVDAERAMFQPAPPRNSEGLRKFNEGNVLVDENGNNLIFYHGTFVDVTEFKKGSSEGNLGDPIYMTNSIPDANRNYADIESPDHRRKVETWADRIYENPEEYGWNREGNPSDNWVQKKARELAGDQHGGAIYPVIAQLKNPVVLDKITETWRNPRGGYPQTTTRKLQDNSTEWAMMDENGMIPDDIFATEAGPVLQALHDVLSFYEGGDFRRVYNEIVDELYTANGEGFTADDLYTAIYRNDDLLGLYRADGEEAHPGQIFKDTLEEAGYDGIIDKTVSQKFGHMGLTPGDMHVVVFDPKQVKSLYNRGTFDTGTADIRYQPSSPAVKEKFVKASDARKKIEAGTEGNTDISSVDPSALPFEYRKKKKASEEGDSDLEGAEDTSEMTVVTMPYDFFGSGLADKIVSGEVDPAAARELLEQVRTKLNTSTLDKKKRMTPEQQEIYDKLVDEMAVRFVEDFLKYKDDPDVIAAKGWYSGVAEFLTSLIPDKADRDMFLEFLGGTSPNTSVEQNFLYAVDLYNAHKRGKLRPVLEANKRVISEMSPGRVETTSGEVVEGSMVSTTKQGVRIIPNGESKIRMIDAANIKDARFGGKHYDRIFNADGSFKSEWLTALEQTLVDKFAVTKPAAEKAVAKMAEEPSYLNALKGERYMNGAIPQRRNGGRYGVHTDRILQIVDRVWTSVTKAPKALNFLRNLAGTEHRATIDIWAARFLRRIANEKYKDGRWRLQPMQEQGVKNYDFFLGQDVFDRASDMLFEQTGERILADDLQAIMWFAEKRKWASEGWAKIEDLGDFRDYFHSMAIEEGGTVAMDRPTMGSSGRPFLQTLAVRIRDAKLETEKKGLVTAAKRKAKEMREFQDELRTATDAKKRDSLLKKIDARRADINKLVRTTPEPYSQQ